MLKAFVNSPAHLSLAMQRVANALRTFAPSDVQIVDTLREADLQVGHVIDYDALTYDPGIPLAVIQYCTNAVDDESMLRWQPLWARAAAVWSYYDLTRFMPEGATFYMAPLGIDETFRRDFIEPKHRAVGVMTSGYVSGLGAEAIEEVAIAAKIAGLYHVHLGPPPEGMETKIQFPCVNGIPDRDLAKMLRLTKFVSGLRHREGFEMPAIEGLACGARPIVFERPDMLKWYMGHAEFVSPSSGAPLIDALTAIFRRERWDVSAAERAQVLRTFDWEPIVTGFWTAIKEGM